MIGCAATPTASSSAGSTDYRAEPQWGSPTELSQAEGDLEGYITAATPVETPCNLELGLGPLELVPTTFRVSDFRLWRSTGASRATGRGYRWTLKPEALQGSARRALRQHLQALGGAALSGQMSPIHKVTLSEERRREAGIPPEATWIAWSYPAVTERGCMIKSEDTRQADVAFLLYGGFVYFDNSFVMREVRAASPCQDGGLVFGAPHWWLPEWTKEICEERFQPATLPALVAAGARYFCWLSPGELLPRAPGQGAGPHCPHGGFVYLFHHPREGTVMQSRLNVYFPVLGSGGRTSATGGFLEV